VDKRTKRKTKPYSSNLIPPQGKNLPVQRNENIVKGKVFLVL
jgi:hypothetical protein